MESWVKWKTYFTFLRSLIMNEHILRLLEETMGETLDELSSRPQRTTALALIMTCIEHALITQPEKYANRNLQLLLADACKEALELTEELAINTSYNKNKEILH